MDLRLRPGRDITVVDLPWENRRGYPQVLNGTRCFRAGPARRPPVFPRFQGDLTSPRLVTTCHAFIPRAWNILSAFRTARERLPVSRAKREISAAETARSNGATGHARQISSEHEEEEGDSPEGDEAYRDDTKEKRKVSGRAAVSDDFRSPDLDSPSDPVPRLPRDANGDFDRYTEQDGRSSLYDDYEAKDVAKRGVLSGPEDYEEIEDDDPGDTDGRVKRDQAEIAETLDTSKQGPGDPAEPRESRKVPNSRQVSRGELPKSSNDGIRGFGSRNVTSRPNDPSEVRERTDEVTSGKGGSDAEYERRVEEEIQRRIDSLKEEIQREVQAQRRIRDVEDNNARFDELREREDEEEQDLEGEPIKRSVREIAVDTAARSKTNEKKRSPRREQPHKKRQHRSNETEKSDVSKESEDLTRRLVANHGVSSEQLPSGDLRKKRERVRQVFLMSNDQHQAKKRRSGSYPLSSDRAAVRSENELFMNPDSNLHTNNRMVKLKTD